MTSMVWIPDLDWGVVVMQNTLSLAQQAVMMKAVDDFLGTPESERPDMRAWAKVAQKQREDMLKDGRQILYPDAPAQPKVGLTLPLEEYGGLYHHPAYESLTMSTSPSAMGHLADDNTQHEQVAGSFSTGAPPLLYGSPSAISFHNISLTLHHVGGEEWWARLRVGPGTWLEDDVMKVKFEVGVNGKVKGMWAQAETALEDMAWFEKMR